MPELRTRKRTRGTGADYEQIDTLAHPAVKKSKSNGDIRAFITTSSPNALSSTTEPIKSKIPRKAAPKPKAKSQKPQALYKSTIAAIDKKVQSLDKQVKSQDPNTKFGVNSDHYAAAMAEFTPAVEKLLECGEEGVACAFNLILYLGQNIHGDFYASVKMCGYGEHEDAFVQLDDTMLKAVLMRTDSQPAGSAVLRASPETSPLPDREAKLDVGEYKTGRPNKQQRGQISRQRAEWARERGGIMKSRRETAFDWQAAPKKTRTR